MLIKKLATSNSWDIYSYEVMIYMYYYRVALLPHSSRVLGSILRFAYCLYVSSGFSCFLQTTKHMLGVILLHPQCSRYGFQIHQDPDLAYWRWINGLLLPLPNAWSLQMLVFLVVFCFLFFIYNNCFVFVPAIVIKVNHSIRQPLTTVKCQRYIFFNYLKLRSIPIICYILN